MTQFSLLQPLLLCCPRHCSRHRVAKHPRSTSRFGRHRAAKFDTELRNNTHCFRNSGKLAKNAKECLKGSAAGSGRH